MTPSARPPLTPLTIAKCPTPGCKSIEVKPEKFPSQHIIDRPPYAQFFLVSYEGRCSLCDVPLVGTFEYQAPDKDKPGQLARISTATAEKKELSFMEDLEKEKANVELIGDLLRASFKGARVSDYKSPLDGKKFKIEVEGKGMFLCVSNEYLRDQQELRIRKDFEHQNVARTLSTNPGKYFILGNSGMQEVPTQDAAS